MEEKQEQDLKPQGWEEKGQTAWCERHQRGVKGKSGDLCPECYSEYNSDEQRIETVLMTGQESEAKHLKEAEAIKLLRSKKMAKVQKTPQDYVRESEEKAKKKFDELDNKLDTILAAISKPQTPKSDKLESETGTPKPLKKEATNA